MTRVRDLDAATERRESATKNKPPPMLPEGGDVVLLDDQVPIWRIALGWFLACAFLGCTLLLATWLFRC